jgi:hypothetical protein
MKYHIEQLDRSCRTRSASSGDLLLLRAATPRACGCGAGLGVVHRCGAQSEARILGRATVSPRRASAKPASPVLKNRSTAQDRPRSSDELRAAMDEAIRERLAADQARQRARAERPAARARRLAMERQQKLNAERERLKAAHLARLGY